MKPNSQAKIAWVLYNLLEETHEQLWNRYEKDFMRFVAQEAEEEIRSGERLIESNLSNATDDYHKKPITQIRVIESHCITFAVHYSEMDPDPPSESEA